MNFTRLQSIQSALAPKRVLVIYGPRRVGKTTLAKSFMQTHRDQPTKYDVGDDLRLQQLFNSQDRKEILAYAAPYEVIVIDEAQQIAGIGVAAKILIDEYPHKTIILTGSSSFDLAQQVGEPLTGRKFILNLLPIAQKEIDTDRFDLKRHLNDFLIYGSYPEVVTNDNKVEKRRILEELVSSYLFKDILALDRLRSSELLLNIVKCLAFQIGNEVSLNEIARTVGTDVKTVQRYIDVLEKGFVVKKIKAFSSHQRHEISKKTKYYFYDNGVRNAVIGQFNDLHSRNDIGALWENFVFMELYKKNNLESAYNTFYFWRTTAGKEVDIIQESNGQITAFECKWSGGKTLHFKEFLKFYPEAATHLITKENYLDFLINS